jgi:4-hydroxy-3-polyprenylbenzoate decarboxylase
MGIDATVPFGYEKDFERPVYPVYKVDLSRFFSERDIERARREMKGWVELLSRTGW